jgi:CRISPR-associated protein (TIGR02584 family)
MMKAFKEIYIFVAGVSPQVITETIYALAVSKPPVYPNELYIITTSLGKAVIKDHLIERGILNDLFNEYQIPAVTLMIIIFLFSDSSGKEMDY